MKKIFLFSIIIVLINIATGQENKIDSNLEVGSLPGYFSVSGSGAAVYTIPIELPAARGDMTPRLAFVYNSQSGSGIMGKGWSLSGFSSIRRVNPTLYHDGKVQQLNFGEDDGFMLDGQRLIKIAEHAGGIIEYRTEIDQIAKVLYYPNGGENNYDYWKVNYKNGIEKVYGKNLGSRQYNINSYSGSKYPLVWHISNIYQAGYDSPEINENKEFYQIKFTYEQNASLGECYPSQITYNSINENSSLDDPNYRVIFNYENKEDENQRLEYYQFGVAENQKDFKVRSSKRLSGIDIDYSEQENNWIKTYNLGYVFHQSITKETFLKSIQLGSRGPNSSLKEINKTTFDWNFYDIEYSVTDITNPNIFPIESLSARLLTSIDINGDGKDEITEYKYIQNGYDFEYKIIIHGLNDIIEVETNTYDAVRSLSKGDFNNDGKDELIIGYDNSFKIYSFYNNGTAWFANDNPYINSDEDGPYNQMYASDINGDGLTDLITTVNNNFKCIAYIGTGDVNNIFLNDGGLAFTFNFNNFMIRSVLDFTGDGSAEILTSVVSENTLYLKVYDFEWDFENNTGSFKPPVEFNIPKRGYNLYNDFNGDGKADILQITYNNDYYFYPSYGSGIKNSPTIAYSQEGLNSQAPYAIDMNNDGRTDLLQIQHIGGTNVIQVKVGYAKPDGVHFEFSETSEYTLLNENYCSDMDIISRTFADISGDGILNPVFKLSYHDSKKDLKLIPQDYNITIKSLENKYNGAPDVISDFTNGYGVTTHINYAPFSITYSDDLHTYPLSKYKSNKYIVKEKYINYTEDLKLNHIAYQFSDPIMHKQGKGFLGFINSEYTNYQNNTVTNKKLTIYKTADLYFYPYLSESTTSVLTSKAQIGNISGNSSQILSKVKNTMTLKNTIAGNSKIFYPVSRINLSQRWDANGAIIGTKKSIIEPEDIDDYGNIKKQSQLVSNKILDMITPENQYSFKIETEFSFQNDYANWILNRPDVKKVTKKDIQTNEEDLSITYLTYYSKSNVGWPFLKNSYSIPNSNTNLSTMLDFEYDKYGNKIKETLNASGDSPRITEYEYSEEYNGRFLTASWQSLNGVKYKTQYTYYETFGLLKNIIENPEYEANRRYTKFYYDAFWNNTLTKLPNNLYQRNVISFQGQGKLMAKSENSLYGIMSYIYQQGNETNENYWMNLNSILYDKYNREVLKVSRDQNNNLIKSEIKYDDLGRLREVENPHFQTETDFLSTTYQYDMLGRPQIINKPGASIKNEYNGLATIVKNLNTNVSKTIIKNALGQVKRIENATGIIEYNYNISGTLDKTIVNGIISRFEYDDANRLTAQTDPDLGITRYEYNTNGELIQTRDKNDVLMLFKYDDLGRIYNKRVIDLYSTTETNTFYQDNPGKCGLGLLENVKTLGQNLSYSYEYDRLNRLIKKTELIDGDQFIHQYDFDNETQQLESIVFPSGYSINYEYKPNGSFHQVTDPSGKKVLWESVKNNGMGQLTEYNLGNGITTTKEFDNYGYLTNISSNLYTQDLNYQFDPATGNLLRRWVIYNNVVNLESFTYDEKKSNNRLTSWAVNGTKVFNINYNDNGNIFKKSGTTTDGDPLSVYRYGNNAGEHALTQIHNPTAEYLTEAESPQSIAYNGHNKAIEITRTAQAKSGSKYTYRMNFLYGPDQARKTTHLYKDQQLLRTKRFIGGDYEEEIYPDGNIRKLHYLSAADGIFAIFVENTMKSDSLYYIHKDYLGSIETITDENGMVLEKLNFDPWGRRRDNRSWNYNPNLKSQYFDRGYTMHEHLNIFGLINMNGRMYDPWVGRMLSPDPFLQDPANLQNYNRYSYAMNNPLKYVDPSGYHHASVFKPGDWDAGITTGGALYINTSFTNDFNGNPFGSYEQRHTYNYDNSSGTWTNDLGQQVSPFEVNANTNWTQEEFSNFVEENSTNLPANTDLSTINVSDGYVEYSTVDPVPSPIQSSFAYEVNRHSVKLGGNSFGSAGGGDGSLAMDIASGSATAFGLATSLRYKLEWEYLRQARINRAISGDFSKPIKHSLRSIRWAGSGFTLAGGIIGGVNFAMSDKSWGDYGQLGVSMLSTGLTLGSATAPIGIGIGVIDAFGGFNGFYNYLDNQQNFYNNTGGIMVPINGIPSFIPLK